MRTILPSVRCQIEVLELITGSSVHVRERAKLVLLTQTTQELTASTASEATERQSGRGTVLATARALSGMCPLQRADWGFFPRQVEAGLRRIGEENSRIFLPVVPPLAGANRHSAPKFSIFLHLPHRSRGSRTGAQRGKQRSECSP